MSETLRKAYSFAPDWGAGPDAVSILQGLADHYLPIIRRALRWSPIGPVCSYEKHRKTDDGTYVVVEVRASRRPQDDGKYESLYELFITEDKVQTAHINTNTLPDFAKKLGAWAIANKGNNKSIFNIDEDAITEGNKLPLHKVPLGKKFRIFGHLPTLTSPDGMASWFRAIPKELTHYKSVPVFLIEEYPNVHEWDFTDPFRPMGKIRVWPGLDAEESKVIDVCAASWPYVLLNASMVTAEEFVATKTSARSEIWQGHVEDPWEEDEDVAPTQEELNEALVEKDEFDKVTSYKALRQIYLIFGHDSTLQTMDDLWLTMSEDERRWANAYPED